MINLSDIHPLTGFLRDHKTHLQRLQDTGKPEVLTVNGKARIVVQDAEAYQKLLDMIDEMESVAILRERNVRERKHRGDVIAIQSERL